MMMEMIKAMPGRTIPLGRQGEHLAREVIFDLTGFEGYGPGTAQLVVKRPNDNALFLVATEIRDGALYWPVTDTATILPGNGLCELRYVRDNLIVKSELYRTYVSTSLMDHTDPTVPPYGDYLESMSKIGAETTQNAAAAAGSAEEAAGAAKEADKSAGAAAGSAESAAGSAEAAAGSAESAAGSAEAAAGSARAAETAKTGAESAKGAAEAAARASEDARGQAVAAQDAAEEAAAAADGARIGAESAKGDAEAAAEAAGEAARDFDGKAEQIDNDLRQLRQDLANKEPLHKVLSATLVTGETTLTFTDDAITDNALIYIYTDVWGVQPSSVDHTRNTLTVTFDAQSTDLGVKVEVR